jgi:hypothetical protein
MHILVDGKKISWHRERDEETAIAFDAGMHNTLQITHRAKGSFITKNNVN